VSRATANVNSDLSTCLIGRSGCPSIGESSLQVRPHAARRSGCRAETERHEYGQPASIPPDGGRPNDRWIEAKTPTTVTSDLDGHYLRRLAGHVETGDPSTSDPAM
jgi:hypothetical protein